jgi:hypothetical protein
VTSTVGDNHLPESQSHKEVGWKENLCASDSVDGEGCLFGKDATAAATCTSNSFLQCIDICTVLYLLTRGILMDHEAVSRGKPCQRCMYQEHRASHGRHARIGITTILHNTSQLHSTRYTLRTQDTSLTWPRSLDRGCSLLNLHESSLPLVLRAPVLKGLAINHF